ncbi:MAG TPA: hypothetical protein VHE12_12195 [bacterium]|nr:hypothetical protein [bacterium]
MTGQDKEAKKDRSLVSEVISKIFEVLATLRLLIGQVQDHWDDQVENFLRRIGVLLLLYLWISLGLLFMVLGIFDGLIEYAKVPQPLVLLVGGLLVLLTSVILLQSTRLRRKRNR